MPNAPSEMARIRWAKTTVAERQAIGAELSAMGAAARRKPAACKRCGKSWPTTRGAIACPCAKAK